MEDKVENQAGSGCVSGESSLDPDSNACRHSLECASKESYTWPDALVLIAMGVDPAVTGWTPFMMKLARGEATVTDAEKMNKAELAHRDKHQNTPFLMAVKAGRKDLAEVLLSRGSDLQARGWCGHSALHEAAASDSLEVMEWLLGLGLPVDILDDFRHSPLVHALSHASDETVRYLAGKGADVNLEDGNGYLPIHEAKTATDIQTLLDHGADVNSISGGGSSPLKDACEGGDAELTRYLLAQGALPDISSFGETALHMAIYADSLECAKLLIEAGADINARDGDGWTCLWYARFLEMAEYLLANGADPGIPDRQGSLPGTRSSYPEVAKLFDQHRQIPGG